MQVYGHIPELNVEVKKEEEEEEEGCVARVTKELLAWKGNEKERCEALIQHFSKFCDFKRIFADIEAYADATTRK